jgi:hypothetical protein
VKLNYVLNNISAIRKKWYFRKRIKHREKDSFNKGDWARYKENKKFKFYKKKFWLHLKNELIKLIEFVWRKELKFYKEEIWLLIREGISNVLKNGKRKIFKFFRKIRKWKRINAMLRKRNRTKHL